MSLKLFSASLLVTGTAIGAGMLALPVATAECGFWPAVMVFLLCCLFMMATGLCLLEACLWLPKDANIVSLSQHLLGKWGKVATWILYLFLFYCLSVAYMAGGGLLITSFLNGGISNSLGILLFVLVFSPIVYLGTKTVDRVNLILMVGLVVSYFAFIGISSSHVEIALLKRAEWPLAFSALPIVFTSFSYQGIIPSLLTYLDRDVRKARLAIIWGTCIPFVIYVIWEALILGIVPWNLEGGLLEAKREGLTAIAPLKSILNSSAIYSFGQAFSFFALTTSFLGVALGLSDFMADGLKWKKTGDKGLFLFALVFGPPCVIAFVNPGIFLNALSFAGGIGCALLLGLFPVLMVWKGRYEKGLALHPLRLKGGKGLLFVLGFFVTLELILELSSIRF